MKSKKKIVMVLMAALFAFSMSGCSNAKSKDKMEVKMTEDGAVMETKYVRVEYKECFPAKYSKYDAFLRKSTNINENLDETECRIGMFNKKVALIAGASKDIKDDPKAAIESLKKMLKEKGVTIEITIVIGDGSTKYYVKVLKPKKSDLPPDIKKVVTNLELALADLEVIQKTTKETAKEAVSLLPLCKNLITSAPTDFTGLDARFAPRAASRLSEASTQLTAAADRAKKVSEKLKELSTILKETFKG